MKRSDRLRHRAITALMLASASGFFTIVLATCLWALIAPHGAAWPAAIAACAFGSFPTAVFTGHSLRLFDASENERHREAQNLIRTPRP